MKYYDEALITAHLDEAMALRAARQVFESLASGQAEAFTSVRNAIGHKDALFGNKSGFDRATMALGLKAGGYWKHNAAAGLANHQSVTVLFDPDTGRAEAALSGNHLTAMRTAAASALAIELLARSDARTLSIVGAGHQAAYQLRAAIRVRSFERILIWNRTSERAEALAKVCANLAPDVAAAGLEETVSQADALITIVSSFKEVVPAGLIQAGTHVSAMGTDTVGKRELAADCFHGATVFADDLKQAATLGEIQHPIASGIIRASDVVALGEIVAGRHPGRTSSEEVTVFDGTGIGLQDLITAKLVLEKILAG